MKKANPNATDRTTNLKRKTTALICAATGHGPDGWRDEIADVRDWKDWATFQRVQPKQAAELLDKGDVSGDALHSLIEGKEDQLLEAAFLVSDLEACKTPADLARYMARAAIGEAVEEQDNLSVAEKFAKIREAMKASKPLQARIKAGLEANGQTWPEIRQGWITALEEILEELTKATPEDPNQTKFVEWKTEPIKPPAPEAKDSTNQTASPTSKRSYAELKAEVEEKEAQAANPDFPELPDSFQAYADEVARVYGVPPAMAALIDIACQSAASGKSETLYFPPHKTPANLFNLIVAESGRGKSSVFKEVTGPLQREQTRLFEQWENHDLPDARGRKKICERNIRRITQRKKSSSASNAEAEFEEMVSLERKLQELNSIIKNPPQLIAEDVTSEKLEELLEKNSGGLSLFSSESGSVLSNIMGKHNSLNDTDEHVLLRSYSGDDFITNRMGRGHVRVTGPWLTICITVTPDQFTKLLSIPRFIDGGLLPRFTIFEEPWDPTPRTNDRIDPAIKQARDKAITDALKRQKRPFNRLTPDAKDLLAHAEEMAIEEIGRTPILTPWLSRVAEQAARISQSIHRRENPQKATIALETVAVSLAIVRWNIATVRRIRTKAQEEQDQARLERIKQFILQPPSSVTKLHPIDTPPLSIFSKHFGHYLRITQKGLKALAERHPKKLRLNTEPRGKSGRRGVLVQWVEPIND